MVRCQRLNRSGNSFNGFIPGWQRWKYATPTTFLWHSYLLIFTPLGFKSVSFFDQKSYDRMASIWWTPHNIKLHLFLNSKKHELAYSLFRYLNIVSNFVGFILIIVEHMIIIIGKGKKEIRFWVPLYVGWNARQMTGEYGLSYSWSKVSYSWSKVTYSCYEQL